jgi:sulfite exporter TauE/SafE
MGIGTSLVLIAIGAVLRFAVSASTHGFNLHTIGVILIIVGAIGLVISLLWVGIWRDRGRRAAPGTYIERDLPPPPPEAY